MDITLQDIGDGKVEAKFLTASARVWAQKNLIGEAVTLVENKAVFPKNLGGFFIDGARGYGLRFEPNALWQELR